MPAIQQVMLAQGASADTPAVVGQALLYSGTGASNPVTGADWSPDLVINKRRSGTTEWKVTDVARGVTKSIVTSGTSAEATEADGLTAFDANGFTVGSDIDYNASGEPYLALLLQEVASAFDIVTYTGTGAAHAENHGLGVVPELILVKRLSASNNWAVYPGPLSSPATKFLILNTSAAVATASTLWNDTAPSSTQFTVGTSAAVNDSADNYVAYLFATLNPGVKVGTFTGDGNTNGPVVTTGFRPRFVLIKRTDAVGPWVLFNDQSDPTSPHNIYQLTYLVNAEVVTVNAAGGLDFQATGFQSIDSANADINIVGATYIYLAVG